MMLLLGFAAGCILWIVVLGWWLSGLELWA